MNDVYVYIYICIVHTFINVIHIVVKHVFREKKIIHN
jgi:hypothetical protein